MRAMFKGLHHVGYQTDDMDAAIAYVEETFGGHVKQRAAAGDGKTKLAYVGVGQCGFVNLDVAVVVAIPVALRVAERDRLAGGWLVAAVALTANATSFLLPSSNLTNLLVLNRSPLRTWTYVRDSWVAWLAVAALTVTVLAVLLARRPHTQSYAITAPGGSARAVIDLVPMYIGAAAIRALVGSGRTWP